ncbi:hypothetical protein NUW58_g4817 [Xylaria curta]|uniref:Uncharacterized protein n=1 Tax=Xylaria curta TaxID=42375 RepID=A0ACC1P5J6_9PEZI|nr:hypothetical protein NUW58_g4817 [Xylaria curta]
MGVAYRILASAGASASASGQAGFSVQPQTTPPSTHNDIHTTAPVQDTLLLRVGDLNGPPIKCYPETTTLSDGVVDAIYDYKPGLFCPDGMTTATRIGTVFLCCPTGLTYTYDGRYDFCSATWTEWTGYAGSWKDLEGAISKTVVYSAADHMRLNVAAPVIWLSGQDPDANPGNGLGSPSRLSPSTPPGSGPPTTVDSNTTKTSTLLKASSNPPNNNNNNNGDGNNNNNNNNGGDGNFNNNNNNKNCRRDDCQITTTALSGTREEPPSPTKQSEQSDLNRSGAGDSVPLGSVGAQVGLGVGGADFSSAPKA